MLVFNRTAGHLETGGHMSTSNDNGNIAKRTENNASVTPLTPRGLFRFGFVFAIATIAWGAASWSLGERITHERSARLIEREQEITSASAASIAANIRFSMAHMRSIPKVLAKESEIEAILARAGPTPARSTLPLPEFRRQLLSDVVLDRVAKRLESILAQLEIDQIWIVNAAGDCLVSGGFRPESSATGVNYADRAYFRMAKEEGVGRQFAVGRTTNTPGIFYSSAVVVDDVFVGVIAVKIDIWRLSRMLTDRNTFLSDEFGVIVAAGDSELAMKAVPENRISTLSPEERRNRYQRETFRSIAVDPVDIDGFPMARFAGRETPMLKAVSNRPADMLTTWVFRDAAELWRIRNEKTGIFLLFFLAGTSIIASLIATLIHFRRTKEHQTEIAGINAELVRLNDDLRIQARFDALTGCTNRRYFLEELGLELKRSARFELPCSIAILDIDHFKNVNDHYGHATGDTLLKQFARTVGQNLRATDLIGRLGGEEFALLMPQTSLPGAVELSERIRLAVEMTDTLIGSHEVRFTVSIGVAQWTGNDDTLEALIARADAAMYSAKNAGRNRVCTAADSGNESASGQLGDAALHSPTL